ncbi:MAG: methyltransferase domain-containing protein [Candidatus Scalinduaceae bacterium]
MGKPKAYRDNIYSTYVSTHTSHLYGETTINGIERQFPVWKWYYGRFLPQDKSANILDTGCGSGGFLYYLRSLGCVNSTGIDVSIEQIEAAKKLGINGVECADIISFLEDKMNSYDLIFARDVLEHLTKDEILKVLETINNALKVDGLLVIQAPNGESLFSGRIRYGDLTHELAFTQDSLNQALKTVGFAYAGFYPTGPVPHGLKSTVRFFLWKMIEKLLRFYMLVETGSGDGIYTQNIIAVARKI